MESIMSNSAFRTLDFPCFLVVSWLYFMGTDTGAQGPEATHYYLRSLLLMKVTTAQMLNGVVVANV